MTTLHLVVFQSDAPTPTAAQVAAGYGWPYAVFADSAVARETTGTQTFPAVTGLPPGTYRAAFVCEGSELSAVVISDIEVVGEPAGTLHLVVFQSDAPTPSAAQVASGYGWPYAVFANSAIARDTSGIQSFPVVTGLPAGSYRAAFVHSGVSGYSDVEISGIEVVVPATPPSFIPWLKSNDRKVLLAEIEVKVSGVETVRYLSTTGYVTQAADTPANTPYLSRIIGGFEFTRSLSIEGSSSTAFGSLQLDNTDGALDAWLTDIWAKRNVKLFLGAPTWGRAQFVQIFDGVVEDIEATSRAQLSLNLRDPLSLLNGPVSTATLGGSGDNADTPLPMALGECFNVEPVLVSATGLATYKLNAGPVEQIIEVRDNGYPVAATETPASGQITLQYQRWGQITCDVQGWKVGADYRRDVGGLIEWLATTLGDGTKLTAGQVDSVNVSAFRAAFPQPVGRWGSVEETRLDVINELAASIGATVTTSRLGKLQILPLAFTASVRDITPNDMLGGSFEPVFRPSVDGKVRLLGSKNWTVQGTDALAAALEANQLSILSEEWAKKSAEDALVMADYRQDDAEEDAATLLVVDADIAAEAQRRLDLWSVPRTVFRFQGWMDLLTLDLGQTITVKHPRLGLSAGALGIITSMGEDYVGGKVTIEVLV